MKLTAINALILLGIAYVGYQTVNGQPVVPPNLDLNPFDNDTPPTPATGTTFPLGRGSRGQYVRNLQQHLGVKIDGVFGVQTEQALLARHGKATVDSLDELGSWVGAASKTAAVTAVATGAAKPVTVATPAKAAAKADPYGTFPLKRGSKGQYVRNLQKALGLKIDGIFGIGTETALFKRTGQKVVGSLEKLNNLTGVATAPVATAPATPKPTAVKPNWPELDNVFRAFWTPVDGSPGVARLRLVADKDAIQSVLSPKDDAQLKAFIVQYNSSYKAWKGVNQSRKMPTLAGDFSQLTIVGGSALATLRDRVVRLSIKR